MRSSFFGLEVSRLALWAQQQALDVTGHNVANASNPAYSRQVISTQASPALSVTGAGQVGTGVQVTDINRMRDAFLNRQIWNETSRTGYWTNHRRVLSELEVILQEPSDNSLRAAFDGWWEGLQELANQPDSISVREATVQRGLNLVESFQYIDRQLNDVNENLEITINERVNRINDLGRRIGDINTEIIRVEGGGQKANDLRDVRDELVRHLAEIVPVKALDTQNGGIQVLIGGRMLVSEFRVNLIEAVPGAPGDPAEVVWAHDQDPVDITGGELGALQHLRAEVVPGYRNELLAMAKAMTVSHNDLHRDGFGLDGDTGLDLFLPGDGEMTLAEWRVNPDIVADPRLLAAAAVPDAAGDGSHALALAQLRHQPVLAGSTIDDYYRSTVADLGIRTQEAQRMEANQEKLMSWLNQQQAEISGVSLDEEMTNMIRYQHSYQAAARMITAVDQMLDVLINRMGVVGR
ncbi:MAG: flagellar hook-associated protein FlgK [Thermaerobacterales bacterium]